MTVIINPILGFFDEVITIQLYTWILMVIAIFVNMAVAINFFFALRKLRRECNAVKLSNLVLVENANSEFERLGSDMRMKNYGDVTGDEAMRLNHEKGANL